MKHPLIDRVATVTAILLFLLAYVPLLLLSAHNHPSAADDYCFADTSVHYGFWQAQIFYYNGWTGRYFSNMLVHGNPLVWNWYDGFRFIPALTVTALVVSLYSLIGEILRDRSTKIRLIATGLLFYTFIVGLERTAETFFWTAAVASYTIPTILTIYLLTVLLRWYRLPTGQLKTLTTVWAGVLVFAIIGSGETNLILLVLLLLAMAGYRLVFLRTFDVFLAYLLSVALVSSWLVFQAPGNAIRLGSNEIEGNILASMISTIRWFVTLGVGWFLKTPVLALSVFWLPIAVRLNQSDSSVRALFQLPALLLTGLFGGLLFVLMFPSIYGLGVPPSRVMNLTYLVFLLGWFYLLTVWIGWLLRQKSRAAQWLTHAAAPEGLLNSGLVIGLAGLWLAGSAGLSPTLRQVYGDLASGQAATYDREMTERHQRLIQPSDTLRLSPISVYPPSIYIDDIHANGDHWWNRCQAGYYGHKVVLLSPK